MATPVRSIRRRTLVVGLAVASFAGAGGTLASLESGSASAAPEVVQLSYGPPIAHPIAKKSAIVPKRPKVVAQTAVRCDVPAGTAHAGDLWRCE